MKHLLIFVFFLQGIAAAQNGLVYQVFVRSFADTPADTRAAGEIGDLQGLRENLDYLNDGNAATDGDLEAGILWLMPIFPSPTYHGYDVTDFRAVNPDYGSLDDMRKLVAGAHRRGLRIIIDLPVNHTSSRHPWFREALNNPSSRFRTWYRFEGTGDGWRTTANASGKAVSYFALFDPGMPDLDFSNAEVRQEIKAVASFWLNGIGIDGFRVDAAKHIFGDSFNVVTEADILRNNAWWREFSDYVYSVKPDAILVGEVLGDKETLRRHAWGNDALLDEPFMKSARARIAAGFSGFVNGWKEFLRSCREVNQLAHAGIPRFQPFTYLASHDETPRLASYLADRKAAGMTASIDQAYRLGMYLLMSIAKHPVLYNGDELMQRGYKWNGNPRDHARSPGDGSRIYDETLREPFPWRKGGSAAPQTSWFASRFDKPGDGVSVEEQGGAGSMLSLVKALGNLRTEHPAFANGQIGSILSDSAEWMVFEKKDGATTYLVLVNTTSAGMEYVFHDNWFPEYRGAQLVFWSDGAQRKWADTKLANKHIEGSVFVPPYGFVLLRGRSKEALVVYSDNGKQIGKQAP